MDDFLGHTAAFRGSASKAVTLAGSTECKIAFVFRILRSRTHENTLSNQVFSVIGPSRGLHHKFLLAVNARGCKVGVRLNIGGTKVLHVIVDVQFHANTSIMNAFNL